MTVTRLITVSLQQGSLVAIVFKVYVCIIPALREVFVQAVTSFIISGALTNWGLQFLL